MAETASSNSQTSSSTVDPISHLPLDLLGSEPIPPALNRSEPPGSSIDWLPNFSGYAWLAYGASSLLVISHFPSPVSNEETRIGPIFRQVLELSGDESSAVNSVAWSPVSPSEGGLAAAAGNCIWLFSHDTGSSRGSFCWRQNAVLVQSVKVEAIKWTGSGDGIISGGIEVILWKYRNNCWEIPWKSKMDRPQTLVSASWCTEEPFATASYYPGNIRMEGSKINEGSKNVLVFQSEENSEYVKTELRHPLPVSMIQWRPLVGRSSSRYAKHVARHVLLTCCLDGTVRLWTEIDNGKVKKSSKDINDQRSAKRFFSVATVIEVNQSLNGVLGSDVYVIWATEIGNFFQTSKGTDQVFTRERCESNGPGKCEWLLGFGPGRFFTYWAVHCLDDISPLRFPRVTMWKKLELKGVGKGNHHRNGFSDWNNRLLVSKVVISRNHLSSPPTICSLIQLSPCNSVIWSLLHTETSTDTEDASLNQPKSENFLSCSATGHLNVNGHNAKILQVALHPYMCESEVAVSLDYSGLLKFWLISNISSCTLGPPTIVPTWELCGELATGDQCSKYSSVRWAPSILEKELILLLGHANGIDCFIVMIYQDKERNIQCHYLCTIPFTGHGRLEKGPTDIFSISLPPSCNGTVMYNKFMLLGIWMNGFQALSWEVTLHCYNLSESHCYCDTGGENIAESSTRRFECNFGSKQYCIVVTPWSSKLPDTQIGDNITCFEVVSPRFNIPAQKNLDSADDQCNSYSMYIMATGCADGSVKLWKSIRGKPSTAHIPWELVGMFVAYQGRISALSLFDRGQKIAVLCVDKHKSSPTIVHIWEFPQLAVGAGTLMLEDTLSFESDVVALSWLALGNGHSLLGVCLQNEVYVYAKRHCRGQTLLNTGQSLQMDLWYRIGLAHTLPSICDFLWGPRTTAIVIYDCYLCVFSPWLFLVDEKHEGECYHYYIKENNGSVGNISKDLSSIIFTDNDIGNLKDLSTIQRSTGECRLKPLVNINKKIDCPSGGLCQLGAQLKYRMVTPLVLISMVDAVEKLSGSLPVYHPEALLMNIYLGNWKRAYVSLRHLVDYLTSDYASKRRCSSVRSGHAVPEITLSDYFEGLVSKNTNEQGFQWSGEGNFSTPFSTFQSRHASSNTFISSSSKSELSSFAEPLKKFYELAGLTSTEKNQVLAIIDLLGEVSNQQSASVYESLDEPGKRYWIPLRFQQFHFLRQFGRAASLEELVVDSGMIGWAYHSDCRENLFGSLLSNQPSWQEMRNLGVGFWFTNSAQLRTQMEKLARLQYLKKKDPKDCALLYIALNRLNVLASLFKLSRDEKERALVGFLSRNFQEEKNKVAALKNAYVLMGRHQLEMAIAFFLLGGDTSSAISLCVKNLGDQQLALVICRLVEGHGGPLEKLLITKFLLPSAIESSDYWLASLLEWQLGNYSRSFQNMLGVQMDSVMDKSVFITKHAAFLDPRIGIYCLSLATKNNMRNAVGEQDAAILGQWATLITATALNRCGLPLEALEYLSSSPRVVGLVDQGSIANIERSNILPSILKPSCKGSSNWLSYELVAHLEYCAKLNLAAQYFSRLIREHPSWPNTILGSGRCPCLKEYETYKNENSIESFQHRLYTGIAQFELKFSLIPSNLISMIFVLLCNHGLSFIGNDILQGFTSRFGNQSHKVDTFFLSLLHKLLLKAADEISCWVSRYICACSLTCSKGEAIASTGLNVWWYHLQGLLLSLWNLKSALSITITSHSSTEDLAPKLLTILDLVEFNMYFASAWLQRNSEVLLLTIQPLLTTFTNAQTPYEVDMENLKKLFPQIVELMAQSSLINLDRNLQASKYLASGQDGDTMHLIPGDERWKITGVFLWQHMLRFMKHKLNRVSDKPQDDYFDVFSHVKFFTSAVKFLNSKSDGQNGVIELIGPISLSFATLLKTALTQVSSNHINQLATSLQHKLDQGLTVTTIVWLEQSSKSLSRDHNQHPHKDILNVETVSNKDKSEILWNMSADPKMMLECFVQEKINLLHCFDIKPSKRWTDIREGTGGANDAERITRGAALSSTAAADSGPPGLVLSQNGHTFLSSWQKSVVSKEISLFQNPKEIYKRNGELLEALCVNSVDQKQAAVASNKKGILFFHWDDGIPFRDKTDYVWSRADWPQNGWADSESTPTPKSVSPRISPGGKRGDHLGSGTATAGVSSLAWPRSGKSGIQSYTRIGTSGLGWETQEDLDEPVDPPATVENISTRVFSSHPSRPFFLVGSSNTHIYLWEFGRNKATATYGVLPATHSPPPYTLASVSSLQFDHCGHRFASAALDGTVCTWQLEVGGRSNILPTESSLCFNGHASDVSYVTSSGSIIAAAGYSTSGVNAVIWDTLAPPTTSRASIMCHEGGARSLSVFNNDIGSGSISPLILTGGKNGDVGLHDFRYIATGRSKRHKHSDSFEQHINISTNADLQTGNGKVGEQNSNGMLWYIPKAHSGSITKISAIPNTSLFLTGSKDGDVKLWDAKRSKLVYHWSKLHDRHTFLQPSSRGFGGVVRAAVTDIEVLSHGFLTCGGDGSVKLVQLEHLST